MASLSSTSSSSSSRRVETSRRTQSTRSTRFASMLKRTSLAALGLLALLAAPRTVAQSHFAAINNATSLAGMWVSGTGQVTTGINFYNPINKTFTVPRSGGIAYSFTDDGFFEASTYTFESNPGNNRCFKAFLTWQHGTFTFNANNSLSLTPFTPDGLVQIMDPCAAVSVQKFQFAQFELYPTWFNYLEPHPGFLPRGQTAYALKMFADGGGGVAGAPRSIMTLAARPANMLPTRQLYQTVLNS